MKTSIILFLFFITACNNKVTKVDNTVKTETKLNVLDTLKTAMNDKIIMQDSTKGVTGNVLLKKDIATKTYGKPLKEETLLVQDLYGEFRGEIYNKYTDEERRSNTIKIEEVTWEKDSSNNITIWYQIEEKQSTPKAILIWEKGSEF